MKKIIIPSLFFVFLSTFSIALAEAYPTTCPTEAQSVLKAVGGCSVINSKTYQNIYTKCCANVVAPIKTVTPYNTSVTPKNNSQTETVTSPTQQDVAQPAQKDFRGWEPASSTVTDTSVETVTPTPENKPATGFVGFVKNIFVGFFKFFGFGK